MELKDCRIRKPPIYAEDLLILNGIESLIEIHTYSHAYLTLVNPQWN